MKIVQIIPNLGFGGAEIMCETLIYELLKYGEDVTLISLFNDRSEITKRMEKKGVNIRYLNKKIGFDYKIIFQLRAMIMQLNPDIIHTHLSAGFYANLATLGMKKIKRVHTVHNVADKELGSIQKKGFWLFYRMGTIPVALTRNIQDTIIETYKLKSEKVPVIFNGVSLERCKKKDNYQLGQRFNLIHIGRFALQKNHKELIEAFDIIHSKIQESCLWLIGKGEKENEIKQMVQERKLSDSVKFLGIQSNVYPYLTKSDVFILPSIYEGMPMTIIEAMGTGLPIIASRVGGIPDMIEDGVSGILVGLSSIELYKAVMELYVNDSLRNKLGNGAYKASIKFSAEAMAEKYMELYERGIR